MHETPAWLFGGEAESTDEADDSEADGEPTAMVPPWLVVDG